MATIGKYGKIVFSESDIQFLKDNFNKMNNDEIAHALDAKKTTVRTTAYKLGLKRMELEYWTKEQVNFLKSNYKAMGDVEIAEFFQNNSFKAKGWTKKHIEKKRRYLKLKRTPAEISKIKIRNTEQGRFAMCAKKRWETIGITPIGTQRVWKMQSGKGFVVIRLETGFVHYNRWLWEQNFGKLKSDQLVVPKDGVKLFCDIDDLEVIDRSEHAIRNKTHYNRYGAELQEIIKLKIELQKAIKKQQK